MKLNNHQVKMIADSYSTYVSENLDRGYYAYQDIYNAELEQATTILHDVVSTKVLQGGYARYVVKMLYTRRTWCLEMARKLENLVKRSYKIDDKRLEANDLTVFADEIQEKHWNEIKADLEQEVMEQYNMHFLENEVSQNELEELLENRFKMA